MFETWEESANYAVDAIFQSVRAAPKISVPVLRRDLDQFIDSLFKSQGGNKQAEGRWASLGADAIELSRKTSQPLTVAEVTRTLVRKQRDYGPENIARFGRQGLMIRCHDKVARLENLLAYERDPENESVHDTYMDIVGYSAIGIMWESRTFLLPWAS